MVPFLDYIRTMWFGRNAAMLLSFFNELHRTNNYAKSNHKRFQDKAIWNFISKNNNLLLLFSSPEFHILLYVDFVSGHIASAFADALIDPWRVRAGKRLKRLRKGRWIRQDVRITRITSLRTPPDTTDDVNEEPLSVEEKTFSQTQQLLLPPVTADFRSPPLAVADALPGPSAHHQMDDPLAVTEQEEPSKSSSTLPFYCGKFFFAEASLIFFILNPPAYRHISRSHSSRMTATASQP